MPNLRLILSLGLTSHQSVLRTLGHKQQAFKFVHGAVHELRPSLLLIDSYHTSRYNISTGRLTRPMFADIIRKCLEILG